MARVSATRGAPDQWKIQIVSLFLQRDRAYVSDFGKHQVNNQALCSKQKLKAREAKGQTVSFAEKFLERVRTFQSVISTFHQPIFDSVVINSRPANLRLYNHVHSDVVFFGSGRKATQSTVRFWYDRITQQNHT